MGCSEIDDEVLSYLAVSLGTTLSEALATLSTARHVDRCVEGVVWVVSR